MAASARKYYALNRTAIVAKACQQVKERRRTNPDYDRTVSRNAKRRKLSDPAEYSAHLEQNRRWRKQHPDRVKAFKHEQRPYRAARTMKRYAAKRNATPAWADLRAISSIYECAAELSAKTGIKHEVDHIVPLLGELVCGLHVPWNLRIVPASVNREKSNRFNESHVTDL
ncbi:hypothetical protein [Paraburkholderia sp. MM6662-R1]|uniref:hypothetical protein n=1 Tax=Paraburkholderia sp. MM6662-R1 TaxID=2991066 RepID=UPI003D260DC1